MIGPKTSAVLMAAAKTPDAVGGDTTTWEDVAEVTEGFLQPLAPNEKQYGDKQTVFIDHRYIFDQKALSATATADLIEGNRIRIGSVYYRVQGVTDMSSRTWEIDLLRIK